MLTLFMKQISRKSRVQNASKRVQNAFKLCVDILQNIHTVLTFPLQHRTLNLLKEFLKYKSENIIEKLELYFAITNLQKLKGICILRVGKKLENQKKNQTKLSNLLSSVCFDF